MVRIMDILSCVLCCIEEEEEDEYETTPDFLPPPNIKTSVFINKQKLPVLNLYSGESSGYHYLPPPPTIPPLVRNNSTSIKLRFDPTLFVKPQEKKSEVPKTYNSSLVQPKNTESPRQPSLKPSSSVPQHPVFKPSPLSPSPTSSLQNVTKMKPQVPKTYNSSLVQPKNTESPRQPSLKPSSSVPQQPVFKPSPLSPLEPSPSSSLQNVTKKKAKYVLAQKDTSPLYSVPEDIKELIDMDIVPQVLRKRVTSSTYGKYFAALLYAEDAYIEKWSNYCLHDVMLELHKATIYAKSSKNRNLIVNEEEDDKLFVAFHIDSIPERRPFLLSRDFVLLQPLDKIVEPFRGILYRVVKSNLVLAEFGDDFHLQHSSNRKYDVSFSFNRVCLKRCHQAVAAATDHSFENILFPGQKSRTSGLNTPRNIPSHSNLNQKQVIAVNNISRLKGSPPFLLEGPLSVITTSKRLSNTRSVVWEKNLSATGLVIQEAVLQIRRTSPDSRILINAPTNKICDVFMTSLRKEIPGSEIFRANAAFRELDGVPYDILPMCPLKGECFTCPPLQELQRFKVVLSTFVSSFRLHNTGISMGHFSHIFLVDASSTTEPETMVALANLADEKTVVVVTGAIDNCSGWVRSNIARRCGLKISYFQRLLETEPYHSLDPMYVACI